MSSCPGARSDFSYRSMMHTHRPRASPARSICAAGTLRRAARSVTRVYDNRLAPSGLTTMQFSILRHLQSAKKPVPLMELADELVFERTSLYRALHLLRRERLITFTASSGRAKAVSLTQLGGKRTAAAVRYWREAQDEFLKAFGTRAWGRLARHLVDVVGATRSVASRSQ
jgi:DNA-binding MarR family transcriptional regulator